MQQYQYFFKSKYYENLPHCTKFIRAYCAKVSTFYHIMTFLGNFCNNDKLSILKQQHVDVQNKHGKGYPWHFYGKERCKTLF